MTQTVGFVLPTAHLCGWSEYKAETIKNLKNESAFILFCKHYPIENRENL